MSKSTSVTMLVYFPKPGKEKELLAIVEKHWPTLDRVGLVTKTAAQIWRATDIRTRKSHIVELFQWKDEKASEIAHQTPEVMAVWEPMGPIMENTQLLQVEQVR